MNLNDIREKYAFDAARISWTVVYNNGGRDQRYVLLASQDMGKNEVMKKAERIIRMKMSRKSENGNLRIISVNQTK